MCCFFFLLERHTRGLILPVNGPDARVIAVRELRCSCKSHNKMKGEIDKYDGQGLQWQMFGAAHCSPVEALYSCWACRAALCLFRGELRIHFTLASDVAGTYSAIEFERCCCKPEEQQPTSLSSSSTTSSYYLIFQVFALRCSITNTHAHGDRCCGLYLPWLQLLDCFFLSSSSYAPFFQTVSLF